MCATNVGSLDEQTTFRSRPGHRPCDHQETFVHGAIHSSDSDSAIVLSGAIAFLTIVLLLHPAAPRAARFVAAQGPSISTLSDEFRDSANLGEWKRHDAIEGWPSQLLALDVNTTSPGHLYMEPFTSVWYAGFRAPSSSKKSAETSWSQPAFSYPGGPRRSQKDMGPWPAS